MAFNKINKPYVFVNKIVNNIKEEIINGNIKPGQRIIETHIAREMGVSRSPLREAIQKLKAENVLKVTPYRGTYVNTLSREIYAIEKIIENSVNVEFIKFINILDKKVK